MAGFCECGNEPSGSIIAGNEGRVRFSRKLHFNGVKTVCAIILVPRSFVRNL